MVKEAAEASIFAKQTAQMTSLFCLSLVKPGTYEPQLLFENWEVRAGIFACDNHLVISNVSADILFTDKRRAPQVSIITTSMDPPFIRGKMGKLHALNTPIFTKAWDLILFDGRFRNYDWTVKLDVDAVMVAPRVRWILLPHLMPNAKIYMQNVGPEPDLTGNHLHGPLEVLSKAAVEAYGAGAQRCKLEDFSTEHGEDYYLNFCLLLLDVRGIVEPRLLQDAYQWGATAVDCTSEHACFHPVKTLVAWNSCVNQIGPNALAPLMGYDLRQLALFHGSHSALFMNVFLAVAATSMLVLGATMIGRRARRHLDRSSRAAADRPEWNDSDRSHLLEPRELMRVRIRDETTGC